MMRSRMGFGCLRVCACGMGGAPGLALRCNTSAARHAEHAALEQIHLRWLKCARRCSNRSLFILPPLTLTFDLPVRSSRILLSGEPTSRLHQVGVVMRAYDGEPNQTPADQPAWLSRGPHPAGVVSASTVSRRVPFLFAGRKAAPRGRWRHYHQRPLRGVLLLVALLLRP